MHQHWFRWKKNDSTRLFLVQIKVNLEPIVHFSHENYYCNSQKIQFSVSNRLRTHKFNSNGTHSKKIKKPNLYDIFPPISFIEKFIYFPWLLKISSGHFTHIFSCPLSSKHDLRATWQIDSFPVNEYFSRTCDSGFEI